MGSQPESAPSFLLLLPAAPSPLSHDGLRTMYGDTLRQVLKEVASASQESQNAAILEVALACPHLATEYGQPRRASYGETQAIVAGLYKLICVLAAKDSINIEDADGIDVRIMLVAWSPLQSNSHAQQTSYGPVISLKTLAACQRPWQYAFGVENEHGEAFVRAFVEAKNGQRASVSSPSETAASIELEKSNKGKAAPNLNVVVGGTFDHIHVGHKLLLTMCVFAVDEPTSDLQEERSLVIGITGDELLKNKKYAEQLESWHDRQQSVDLFLRSLLDFRPPGQQPEPTVHEITNPGPNGHSVTTRFGDGLTIRYVEIWDPFGPTITEENLDALVISGETRSGGKAVNDKRTEKGWPALQVLEVEVLDPEEDTAGNSQAEADNFSSKLSSTEIRKKLSTKTASSL